MASKEKGLKMKLNVEVDIDWINEDSSIDEEIENQIKESIVRRVEAKIVKDIKLSVDELFENSLQAQVDKILDGYLNKAVVVSNGYKTESYDSALQMIEDKFSSLYDSKFSGKLCDGDALMKKINDKISYEVTNVISKVNSTIDREAKAIAKKELEDSSLYKAVEKLGALK